MAPIGKKEPPPKTVDEYLASVPEGARAALESLRRAIKAAAPMAEESIFYFSSFMPS